MKRIRNSRPARGRRGVTTVMALFVMLVLITLALVVAAILAGEGKILVSQIYGQTAYFLADAGVELGIRAIRDDVTETTQYGTGDLRPGTIQGTAGSGTLAEREEEMLMARYYNEGEALTLDASGEGTYIVARDFDPTCAGLGCLIKSGAAAVQIGCRYRLASPYTTGTAPSLKVEYTVDGTFIDAPSTVWETTVTSADYNTTLAVLDISADRAWTWENILALGSDYSTNFGVKATAFGSVEYKVEIDCVFLRVSYEIDDHEENWFIDWSNSDETPKEVDLPLGVAAGADAASSNIHTLSLLDEDAKVNLNYANTALMTALFEQCGIGASRAAAIAAAIVDYRASTGLLRLPKEVYQLGLTPGLTAAEFDQIFPYATLFSGVNKYARRPDSARAPVNINTASAKVLKAVFQPLVSAGYLSAAESDALAAAIIVRRGAAPFTAFYSLDASVTTDFYDFIDASGLGAAAQNAVLNNASPSLLVPVCGSTDAGCLSANFSYASNAFTIDCQAKKDPAQRRVKVIGFDDGSFGPTIE